MTDQPSEMDEERKYFDDWISKLNVKLTSGWKLWFRRAFHAGWYAAGERKPCIWEWDNEVQAWDTECGECHEFMTGNPDDNSYRFCPYCGGKLDW